jgi:hypothetical protein
MPSSVISAYVISASKRGSTHVVSAFFSGFASGAVGRAKMSLNTVAVEFQFMREPRTGRQLLSRAARHDSTKTSLCLWGPSAHRVPRAEPLGRWPSSELQLAPLKSM